MVTRAHLLPVSLGFRSISLRRLKSLVHLMDVLVCLISVVYKLVQVLFVGSLSVMCVEAGSFVSKLGCLGLHTLRRRGALVM